ncbi:dTDP-4-dehydrorhamnose reductase, partial [Flavobacteriales bacterium]|nr:dTDP-4-dehydrorhamnose reductase [Flavobacteriales bacterium]
MNILVLGSNGQLGSEIKEIAVDYKDFNFLFRDLPELNICKKDALNTFILNKNIDLVINCAAYTAVDKAEENAEIAEQVNSLGVQNLVNALEKVNGKLIHISTDYVFDGCNSEPYKESDHVNPLGVYGKTKREGELFVINSSIDSIVIRTSWLYSSFGNNFVKTMYRLGNEKNFLSVISDQIGTPTYARDLAKVCLDIISISDTESISNKGKVYHYSNEGVASWYDFAITIMELSGSNCVIKAIQTID